MIEEPFPEDRSFSDSSDDSKSNHDLPPELLEQDSEGNPFI